ncbi:MAG: tetratricopeptide repeat protein [Ignavibacteriales bacterium]|nr:tetratricopeptide repeat protein [Ignavibacteriales bacterium]
MKKRMLIFFGIVFTIININAQSTVSDGEKAIKDKDYAKALKIASEMIEANNTSDAFKLLIPLEQKGVMDKKLFEYFGDAYAQMNVTENAINYYAKAEAIDSLDIALKFKSAETFVKAERYTEAVNKYLKIVQIDPNNAKAFIQAATILYKAKLYADAAVMYEKYLALDQTEDAYQKITRALLESKSYEKVYQFALEGLKKYPNNSLLNKGAAISSFVLQKFDEAGKYYSAVPDSEMTVSDLKNAGRAFQLMKNDSTAIKYYERVIQKDSTQSALFMDMANNYFRNKDYEMAIKYYTAKIKLDPTYEPAYRNAGFAYYEANNWDGARQAFLKAKELSDTTFTTNYWLAQVYTKMDSSDQAAEQYVKILKLTEGRESQFKDYILEAVVNLGQRAFLKKNYTGAITYYRRANQIKPNDWRYMESLGACYQTLQNYDEAIKWYCATVKINPKSENARKGLRMMSADDCIPKNGK